MKIFVIIILALMTSTIFAKSNQTGVGVMLGNPTGLNAKQWLDNGHAVDGGLALSLGKNSNLSIHSDYLLQVDSAFYFKDDHALDFYYGLGGRMEFADDIELGVRAPLGLSHRLKEKDADLFGEIAPILDFIGRTGVEMHFAVGARYYF